MIELKNKYIIGTHVMFYEIDIINEHVQSINNALETVSNKQNVTVDLFFNISEYFEKVDTEQISKEELIEKFNSIRQTIPCKTNIEIYDKKEPITMVEYRRNLCYFNCNEFDYVIWGESDCLIPREFFQCLETVKSYAVQNNIHKFITTFATRKMWDDSWKILEHPEFTDKQYYEKYIKGTRDIDERAYNEPHSIRYTMSIDEMNLVNSKSEELDIRLLKQPKFDGSCLIMSSDLLKTGVNIPTGFFGLSGEDTAFMQSCMTIMGSNYIQFVIKNILKVHNREHPKKRRYALNMMSKEKSTQDNKGDWYNLIRDMNKKNLQLFGGQHKYLTYEDFEKELQK